MENLLTVKDVAKIVGVTTKTIWKMEKEGRCPKAIRRGKRVVRWKSSDVVAWINADDLVEEEK